MEGWRGGGVWRWEREVEGGEDGRGMIPQWMEVEWMGGGVVERR